MASAPVPDVLPGLEQVSAGSPSEATVPGSALISAEARGSISSAEGAGAGAGAGAAPGSADAPGPLSAPPSAPVPAEFVIEADGGSRGNPGPAGYGAVVVDAVSGELLAERSGFLGVATNNVAEYSGLLAGLRAARSLNPGARVRVRMDSKLVVEQMSGRWQIKHPALRPLAAEARRVLPGGQVSYEWMPRSQNKRADRLANKAMDAGQRGEAPTENPLHTPPPSTPTPQNEAHEPETTPQTDADTDTGTQAGAGAYDDARAETHTGARAEAEADARTEARAEAGADAGAYDGARAETHTGARVEADADARTETRAEADTRAGAYDDARAGTHTEADARARAYGNARTETPADADAHDNARAGTHTEAETETATRTKAPTEAGAATRTGPPTPHTPSDTRAARNLAAPDMSPPATLVLLRHGETPLTPQKRFSGSGGSDPGLSEAGREQAVRVAEALARRGTIEVIVTSPLARTRETAEIVAARLGLDVVSEDGLRETDFGAWEGLTFGEVRERYPADMNTWLADPEACPTGGGESFAEVADRVAETRDRLTTAYAGRTILVVSHVTPIKTLIRLALGAPPEALFRMDLSAASLSAVAYYADGNANVRLVNDTSHLR